MSYRSFCDRCGNEVLKFAQVRIADANGGEVAQLCEACSVDLLDWVGRKIVRSSQPVEETES